MKIILINALCISNSKNYNHLRTFSSSNAMPWKRNQSILLNKVQDIDAKKFVCY